MDSSRPEVTGSSEFPESNEDVRFFVQQMQSQFNNIASDARRLLGYNFVVIGLFSSPLRELLGLDGGTITNLFSSAFFAAGIISTIGSMATAFGVYQYSKRRAARQIEVMRSPFRRDRDIYSAKDSLTDSFADLEQATNFSSVSFFLLLVSVTGFSVSLVELQMSISFLNISYIILAIGFSSVIVAIILAISFIILSNNSISAPSFRSLIRATRSNMENFVSNIVSIFR